MVNQVLVKALADARELSQLRLRGAAQALERVLPAGGVLLSAKLGHKASVQLRWPGVLVELDEAIGQTLTATPAADMFDQRPHAAELLTSRAKGRPVLSTVFVTPNGSRLRACIDAAAVVKVYSVKTRELLAISEPGQPAVLRANFQPLRLQDLSPRYQ